MTPAARASREAADRRHMLVDDFERISEDGDLPAIPIGQIRSRLPSR